MQIYKRHLNFVSKIGVRTILKVGGELKKFKGGKRVLNPLQNNFFGILSVWEYYKLLHLKIVQPEKV